jgi:biotin operon repressor
MKMPKNATRPTTGPRFVPPPGSIFQHRPLIDSGLAAVLGGALAAAFMALLLGLFARAG